jgi:hypothetical protein
MHNGPTTSCKSLFINFNLFVNIVARFALSYSSHSFSHPLLQPRAEGDVQSLETNKDAWSLPIVSQFLESLVNLPSSSPSLINASFSHFSLIEQSRLLCLLSDYSSALQRIAPLRLSDPDPNELFVSVPNAHINLLYHSAVSLLMSRRYSEAQTLLSNATSLLSRLARTTAPSSKSTTNNYYQKMLDKVVYLLAIAISLLDSAPLDDSISDLIVSKCGDKLKRLRNGDISSFEEAFEISCPKFISPGPSSDASASGQDAWVQQVAKFSKDIQQQVVFTRVRSYLKLYSSIEVGKLAKLSRLSEEELRACLSAFASGSQEGGRDGAGLAFTVQGDVVSVQEGTSVSSASRVAVCRYFLGGIRKNLEMADEVSAIFSSRGL